MAGRRILMRAGCSPFEYLTVKQVSDDNLFGDNVGNLLYAFSIFRWLMTDDETIPEPDRYRPERGLCSDAEIDEINRTYDCYILPMADTFRKTFEQNLVQYTEFIKKLRIPVILAGVGISGSMKDGAEPNCASDEVLKPFLNAVLDHSALIGLRGEHTLELLEKKGYREGEHITAIGCPSLYTYGRRLKMSDPLLDGKQKIILTNNIYASRSVHRFIRKTAEEHPNYFYIPQRIEELRMYHSGRDMNLDPFPKDREEYPATLSDPFFRKGQTCFPMNIPGWMKLVRGADLAVGPRLHGSIVCMLSGVPALLIQKDWRTREVGEFHHFAMVSQFDLKKVPSLEETVSGKDFHGPEKVQKDRFMHYRDFLRKNGIPNIYENTDAPKEVPFDRKLKKARLADGIYPYTHISRLEQIRRNHPHPVKELLSGK